MQRAQISELIAETLTKVLAAEELPPPEHIDESTPLVGGSVIDSLGLVELIVEIEQRLRRDRGANITLADDKAMSQKNSPFRTIGTLANYIESLLEERSALGR
jgi:acyl carrier protein